ncbi:L,D-transpeptidase family protein [Fodinicurvata halophila]|uniref:L,D-transpeptidase family protein n=1 Tax=Fodinicurvata halophila TaxID=1419723 RepID=UPI0036260456
MVPPGPENPLGTRALYLGWPAYLIHGTNNPYGIGRRASAGCIRMYPEDVEEIYPDVPIGTAVKVKDEPVKIAWVGDALYLEVHPTQTQADQVETQGYFEPRLPENLIDRVMRAAGTEKGRLNWQAIDKAGMERRGYPVQVNV